MTIAPDPTRVEQFLGQVLTDAAAAVSGITVALGDRLGLYTVMAGAGPLSSEQVAERSGTVERYVREWLACQVAGGYVAYDPEARTYTLPDEHAAVLADPLAPTYLAGAFLMLNAVYGTEDALAEAFRTGRGVGWDAHPESLFTGTAKFFRPGYLANVTSWLAALDGVEDKLRGGGSVADVGCGFGYSTMLMAQAFPASTFVGFDYHRPSVDAARKLAADAGMGDRVHFEVATAQDFPGSGYDLITNFDCLHDMGDPGGAAAHARRAIADDGTWMIVEPNASEDLAENVGNPVGRMFYAASVAICLPAAVAQDGPVALGNHAGEDAVRDLVTAAGWSRWRRATENPVNRVYEARP